MCTIDAYCDILLGNVPIRMVGIPTIYRCAPDWSWKPPPLRDFDLWCVLSGRGTLDGLDDPFPLAGGSCCIIPPGASPLATHHAGTPLTVFAIHFETLDLALPPPKILTQQVNDISFLSILAERCVHSGCSSDLRVVQSVALIRQIMLLILVESQLQDEKSENIRIDELVATIRRSPERAWTVEDMAEFVCLSRSQLTRLIRRFTGVPPTEFLIRCRLERACQMLIETRRSVSEIADALGYEDTHYFSRQFKTRYGESPKMFRNHGM